MLRDKSTIKSNGREEIEFLLFSQKDEYIITLFLFDIDDAFHMRTEENPSVIET